MKNSEVHLFIVWDFARKHAKQIIDDIGSNFEILDIYDIAWTLRNFSDNLSRFYGINLPPKSSKEEHIGKGPFLLVIVRDYEKKYDYHETSKGKKYINSRMFISKTRHREWTGGGHRIHGTNTIQETTHDLKLLLGERADMYLNGDYRSKQGKTVQITKDLEGADGWGSVQQLFDVMHSAQPYVVMRNFDILPDQYYAASHGDIDLLVEDMHEASYVMNTTPVFEETHRVHHKTRIQGEDVFFDLRFKGDNYYDPQWQHDILKRRIADPKGFYRPSDLDYIHSLFYHAYIHKPHIRQDYIDTLTNAWSGIDSSIKSVDDFRRELALYMKKHKYKITQPRDITVGIHPPSAQWLKDRI